MMVKKKTLFGIILLILVTLGILSFKLYRQPLGPVLELPTLHSTHSHADYISHSRTCPGEHTRRLNPPPRRQPRRSLYAAVLR